jgi:NAD-dependent deacetylase
VNRSLLNQSDPAEVAAIIRRAAGGVVALTGAGISVDSGIPDFRSGGGIWERYDPAEYATLSAFRRDPAKVWAFFRELEAPLARARPNRGHLALRELEERGLLTAVITQNIDNLHTAAGCTNVIELHGSTARMRCSGCRAPYARATVEAQALGWPPICPACGAPVKPDVVLFEEPLPEGALDDAAAAVAAAKVLLTVGTSGLVSPANTIPYAARRAGATIVEVNLEETVLTAAVTDYFLKGSSSTILPELARLV